MFYLEIYLETSPVACDLESQNYSTILPYYVVHYVGHAVPRYNGAFPKWREGRASGCWFLICPETGELQLGASRYDSKKDKGEEDDSKKDGAEEEREERLRKSHVTRVSRVYSNAAYYMLLL